MSDLVARFQSLVDRRQKVILEKASIEAQIEMHKASLLDLSSKAAAAFGTSDAEVLSAKIAELESSITKTLDDIESELKSV